MKRLIRMISLCGFLVCVWCTAAVAQQSASGGETNYEGTWASNYVHSTSTAGATFVHIERLAENRYFVISFSNASKFFTFVGGGFVRDDGVLQVTTDTGFTHLYSPMWVRGHDEALTLTDPNNVENFGPFVRLERKFSEWPFQYYI